MIQTKMIVKASDNRCVNNALIAFAKELSYSVANDFPTDLTTGYISFGTSKEADINYKTKNDPEEYYARKFGITSVTSLSDAINTLVLEKINQIDYDEDDVDYDEDDDNNSDNIDEVDFTELLPKFIYKVKQMKQSIKNFNLYFDNELSEYFLKKSDTKLIPDCYTLIGNLFDLSQEHLN